MKVVAVAFSPIARFVDQGAHNGDAEATDRASLWRSIQVGPRRGQRIEGPPIVDEIHRQLAPPPAERNRDTARRNFLLVTVRNDVREKPFEDDEQPCPFVIGEATIASERLGEGFEPGELGSLAT